MQCLPFCDWIIYLAYGFRVCPCCSMRQNFKDRVVFHCICILHFVSHSSVNEHLNYFHLLAIVIYPSVNVVIKISQSLLSILLVYTIFFKTEEI